MRQDKSVRISFAVIESSPAARRKSRPSIKRHGFSTFTSPKASTIA